MESPLFFLHFPRTAGTTIDKILFANFSKSEIIKIYSREEFDRYRFIEPEILDNIKYITGHLILESVDPPRFYGRSIRAFTFLRQPVKRLVSEYIFLKTWKENHLYDYLNSRKVSFGEYIASQEKLLKYRGKNFMTRCLSGDSLEDVTDPEASLEKAKNNIVNNFFFFGLQEYFMESLLMLGNQAKLANILHQKHNSLNRNKIDIVISDEEKQIASEYNDLDIRLYNYARDIFLKRIENEGENFQTRLKTFQFLNAKYQKVAEMLYESSKMSAYEEAIHIPKEANW